MYMFRTKYFTRNREVVCESWRPIDRLHRAADIVADLTEELKFGAVEWVVTDNEKILDSGLIIGE